MPKLPARCPWAEGSAKYAAYHDHEWGVPVHDDRVFFEFLLLEGAQAGLSWSTILNKRDGYRGAFAGFEPEKVARFDARRVARLLGNEGIVRNRLKVASAVGNARAFLATQEEFGSFDAYVWAFVDGRARQNRWRTLGAGPRENGAIGRAVEGPRASRLSLRRLDDRLCVHAGDGPRQRPLGELPALARSAAAVSRESLLRVPIR